MQLNDADTAVRNSSIMELPSWGDSRGCLVALEGEGNIPFPIQRIYYIYDVPREARRGFHSHKDLEQVLVCVHGEVSILIDDGYRREVVKLSNPAEGLRIGPMVWREMFNFSEGAVLLVLASRHYNPEDYEKDYDRFKAAARDYFRNERR